MSHLNEAQKASFLLMSDHPNQYYEQLNDAMKQGYNELNKLDVDANFIIKDTFFSARNIDLIQRWIIKEVLLKTKILIPYQKMEHIMAVMNSIYNIYGQNLPFALKEQIYELDNKVVYKTVESIIAEIQSRAKYNEAINSTNFIEQPLYTGSRGQRALPTTM